MWEMKIRWRVIRKMNDKEFLNFILTERMGMLLSKKPEEENSLMEEAQNLINELDTSKREVLMKFLDAMLLERADFERKAYLGGFEDGTKVAAMIYKKGNQGIKAAEEIAAEENQAMK